MHRLRHEIVGERLSWRPPPMNSCIEKCGVGGRSQPGGAWPRLPEMWTEVKEPPPGPAHSSAVKEPHCCEQAKRPPPRPVDERETYE